MSYSLYTRHTVIKNRLNAENELIDRLEFSGEIHRGHLPVRYCTHYTSIRVTYIVHIYICVCVCVCINVYTRVRRCAYIYLYIHSLHVRLCVCVSVCARTKSLSRKNAAEEDYGSRYYCDECKVYCLENDGVR
jgi:hypothetical protein